MTYNDLLDLLLATGEVVPDVWPERPVLWRWQRLHQKTVRQLLVSDDGTVWGAPDNYWQHWRLN